MPAATVQPDSRFPRTLLCLRRTILANSFMQVLARSPVDRFNMGLQPQHLVPEDMIAVPRDRDAKDEVVNVLGHEEGSPLRLK